MAKKKKKGGSIKVDFSNVESGGGGVNREGEYRAKVVEVEQREGSAADYLAWTFEVTEGKMEGKKLWYNTSLAEQSLWNLRNLLEALGVEIPEDEMDIEPDELVDLEVVLNVEMEKYEGKNRARVVDFYSADGEKEEEETSKKDSKKKKQIEQDEVSEMDEDELASLVKKQKLDVDLDDYSSVKKKRAAVVEALDAEGLLAE